MEWRLPVRKQPAHGRLTSQVEHSACLMYSIERPSFVAQSDPLLKEPLSSVTLLKPIGLRLLLRSF
jgi:hypothetical protein